LLDLLPEARHIAALFDPGTAVPLYWLRWPAVELVLEN
jgi:hypothetical protein